MLHFTSLKQIDGLAYEQRESDTMGALQPFLGECVKWTVDVTGPRVLVLQYSCRGSGYRCAEHPSSP